MHEQRLLPEHTGSDLVSGTLTRSGLQGPVRHSLIKDITELEELMCDLRDQGDTLSATSVRRIESALARKRRMLRATDVADGYF